MAYDLIAVLGPTATGKTAFAAHLAKALEAEVVSSDSRQVYRGMDIGTGKDLADYCVDGVAVPYHLIDIVDAGYKYNLFEFQRDFWQVYERMRQRGVLPILCGGTGLYMESVLKGYELQEVPENRALRESLQDKSLEELTALLGSYKQLHNVTDVDSVKRAIRAIEIADYQMHHKAEARSFPPINALILGIDISRELRRERISSRLEARLQEGMLAEVQRLLDAGISADDLVYYGLEYKFVTQHLMGELTYREMLHGLEIAIHQFAKRQMTWFRGMERRGFKIPWIDATLSTAEKVAQAVALYNGGQ